MKDISESQLIADIKDHAELVFKKKRYSLVIKSVEVGKLFDYGEDYGCRLIVEMIMIGTGDAYGLQRRANALVEMTEQMIDYVSDKYKDLKFAVDIQIGSGEEKNVEATVDMERWKKEVSYQFHQSTCKANDEVRFHAGEKPLIVVNPHVFAALKKDMTLMRMVSISERRGFQDFGQYFIHCNALLDGKYSYGVVNSAVSDQFFKMVGSGVDHETLKHWTELMLGSGEIIKFELEI